MALDPRQDQADRATGDPLASRVASLERRLDALARSGGLTIVGDGPPAVNAPEGSSYVDRVALRRYERVNGAWRYVALT